MPRLRRRFSFPSPAVLRPQLSVMLRHYELLPQMTGRRDLAASPGDYPPRPLAFPGGQRQMKIHQENKHGEGTKKSNPHRSKIECGSVQSIFFAMQ